MGLVGGAGVEGLPEILILTEMGRPYCAYHDLLEAK